MSIAVTVSNLAWLPKAAFKAEDIFLLKKNLTLVPRMTSSFGPSDGAQAVIECWRETETHVGVPRAYYLKHRKAHHVETVEVSQGTPMGDLQSKITLRPDDQVPVRDKVVEHLNAGEFAGGLIEAYTSFGKTTTALDIAATIGRTTAILVHKEPLANQWKERILEFLPGAKVGMVQGPKADFVGKDFVICMIQSLAGDNGLKYPPEFWRAFGLVIADEVHRLGAPWFSTASPRFYARRLLGLSATLKRADGCENAFRWIIGNVIAKPTEKNKVKPIIYVRKTGFQASWDRRGANGVMTHVDLNNGFMKPTLLKFIARNKHRNALIANDIAKSLETGRVPLVIAERLDILHNIAAAVSELRSTGKVKGSLWQSFYIGGQTEDERKSAAQADVVYATMQLAKEGIDIQRLDTLFIVTPISDPVQLIGRIGRPKTIRNEDGTTTVVPGKHRPMVVDYVDSDVKLFHTSFFSRLKHYKRLELEIIGMKVT